MLKQGRPTEIGSLLAGAVVGILVKIGVIPLEISEDFILLLSLLPAGITMSVEWFRDRQNS